MYVESGIPCAVSLTRSKAGYRAVIIRIVLDTGRRPIPGKKTEQNTSEGVSPAHLCRCDARQTP